MYIFLNKNYFQNFDGNESSRYKDAKKKQKHKYNNINTTRVRYFHRKNNKDKLYLSNFMLNNVLEDPTD